MMQRDVKKFAARILISHLALLALVLAVVFVASRQVYNSAREQTLKQAEDRQELLANQTARRHRKLLRCHSCRPAAL